MSFLTREAERLEAENWLFQHQIPALNLPTHSIIGTVVAAALTSSGNDLLQKARILPKFEPDARQSSRTPD